MKTYPRLGAEVSLGPVPDRLVEELPALYGSLFSTGDWFRIFDEVTPGGSCILSDPRHVLLFHQKGDTVDVLNKAFAIAPTDAARACRALFDALPRARRIHLEVMFPPAELHAPKRVLYSAEDMVVDLHGSPDAYYSSLGKKTRKNVRNMDNRLRRAQPDVTTEIVQVGDRASELVGQFLTWHLPRAKERGFVSGYVSKPKQAAQTTELVRAGAEAQLTSIGGRLAAIEFIFYVGPDANLYAGSFDAAYGDLNLGFLSTYWALRETARRGARRCHLLWGTDYYKTLLGARPERATRLSVFRSQTARLHSLDEAREVAVRDARRRGQRDYWRARHAAGRLVRRYRREQPGPDRDGADGAA
ncbi:MAG TPA: GNAT family N-acetyltransferase [Thermoleophilia bacterium]|nr:GNAT family N-acetyltransferase [Thermoleophilia bacterium]